MIEMIYAEWFKAFRKKRFWGLLIIFGILLPLGQLIIAGFSSTRVPPGTQETFVRFIAEFSSPYALARNTVTGFLPLILLPLAAIVGIFLVGEERTFKMWKTILVANPNRLNVLAAKFITGMLIMGSVILSGLLGSIFFGIFGILFRLAPGFSGDWGSLLLLTFLQWLILAAPLALGFLISWLFASPAVAVIGVVILPGIIEAFVYAAVLFQINRVSALNAPFQVSRLQETVAEWQRYFFTTNLNIGQRMIGEDLKNANLNDLLQLNIIATLEWDKIWWSVGAASVYTLIFAALMIWSFKTRDIHE